MSRIIPKEKLADVRPWQAASFGSPAPRPSAAPPESLNAPLATTPSPTPAVEDAGELVELQHLPSAEDIEAVFEQARQEGFAAGQAEAQEKLDTARQQMAAEASARLAERLLGLEQAMKSIDQEMAEQLLSVALEISRQIIRGTLAIDKEAVLPVIREALQALPLHHGNVVLHLHPEDADALRTALQELSSQTSLQIAPDSAITPGGCLLKSGNSEVDATLETRWKRTLEAIGRDPEAWQTT